MEVRDLGKMTEKQIELVAEATMHGIDKRFMSGEIDDLEYWNLCQDLEKWVKEEYEKIKKNG